VLYGLSSDPVTNILFARRNHPGMSGPRRPGSTPQRARASPGLESRPSGNDPSRKKHGHASPSTISSTTIIITITIITIMIIMIIIPIVVVIVIEMVTAIDMPTATAIVVFVLLFLSLPPHVFSLFLHPSDSFRPFPRAVLPVRGLAMNSGCASAL